ncbi:MAG TPA: ABC transporter substrate-binding protein, partial [Candidatus Solibacter sp.]|nr:ABC transporter substrate-binding protein [Candidatus Solibacter sp.]
MGSRIAWGKTMIVRLRDCRFAGAIAAAFVVVVSAHARAEEKIIKIGGLLPMSGPGSYFGVQDKQGIELALDEINRGGLAGYKFEVK